MSKLSFSKFHGAGNDFILIDDRALTFNSALVSKLCTPKFGVGADGVILLQDPFRMRIFNADGTEAESCGNGLRCFVKFLIDLGFVQSEYQIQTGGGLVRAHLVGDKVAVSLGEAKNYQKKMLDGYQIYSLQVGVPHLVVFEGLIQELGPKWQKYNTNVNVAEIRGHAVYVKTYERGVGETLACGTGALAVGFVAMKEFGLKMPIPICMPGGDLLIDMQGDRLILIGDAEKVFQGSYAVE